MSSRVALVTGSGRGLGAAIAGRLAKDGLRVVVNDLPGSHTAPRVVDRIRAAGDTATFVGADVTDPDGVGDLVDRTRSAYGEVDVLVCNASGPQPAIRLEDLTWAEVERHLGYFVRSPLLLAQAVVPGMRARGWGRIVHVGSDLAERGDVGWSAYGAAKAAMLGLTRAWARELGADGITVNLVAPGWIPVERHRGTPETDRAAYVDQVPAGRFGVPEEVAAAVAFLASADASFVTGERVAVNGGHYLA